MRLFNLFEHICAHQNESAWTKTGWPTQVMICQQNRLFMPNTGFLKHVLEVITQKGRQRL